MLESKTAIVASSLFNISWGRVNDNKNLRKTRYDLRRTKRDIYKDPVKCHCGFGHYLSAYVYCENCRTWQHTLCYHDALRVQDLPFSAESTVHLCEDCDLGKALETLQLQDAAEPQGDVIRKDNPQTCDLLGHEDLYFGPNDQHILHVATQVTALIRAIAHSLDARRFLAQRPRTGSSGYDRELSEVMSKAVFFDSGDDSPLTSLDQYSFLKMIIGVAIWTWTFDPQNSSISADEAQSGYKAFFDTLFRIPLSTGTTFFLRPLSQLMANTLFQKNQRS